MNPVYATTDITDLDDNGWELVAGGFGFPDEQYDFCLYMPDGVPPLDISYEAAVDEGAFLLLRSESGDASASTKTLLVQRSEGRDASAPTNTLLE